LEVAIIGKKKPLTISFVIEATIGLGVGLLGGIVRLVLGILGIM
jgi:hypothetical protein